MANGIIAPQLLGMETWSERSWWDRRLMKLRLWLRSGYEVLEKAFCNNPPGLSHQKKNVLRHASASTTYVVVPPTPLVVYHTSKSDLEARNSNGMYLAEENRSTTISHLRSSSANKSWWSRMRTRACRHISSTQEQRRLDTLAFLLPCYWKISAVYLHNRVLGKYLFLSTW